MANEPDDRVEIEASRARLYLADLFVAAGAASDAATTVAEALVEADLQATGSHGMLQATTYLRRLRAGTISGNAELKRVHESGAVTVFDAGLALGHAVAQQAMDQAVATARTHGMGAAAVRAATHFGIAGRHARVAADAGLIGIAMCNSRPMLPAPGGSRAVVGNNPLAIAVPMAGREPIVFDMAMSAVAMGKVRLAAERGEAIPEGWALDATGRPTTDAAEAVRGMLLPAAGAKGFGLALMVDFLCALAGGSAGAELAPMYGDPASPADCSWLLLGIDPVHFGLTQPYAERVAALAGAILADEGTALPGDRKLAAERDAGGMITVPRTLVRDLDALSAETGGPPPLLGAP
ncbi:Ldh family oxidoreductase [Mesorhizobium sp. CAU 1741]|uniref:Ldh family oxidoreductase n=1 Tax=Mesorhizobium sp. CAU 1741 TaxID=3140366 RepID=UPI00325A727F